MMQVLIRPSQCSVGHRAAGRQGISRVGSTQVTIMAVPAKRAVEQHCHCVSLAKWFLLQAKDSGGLGCRALKFI